MTKFFACCITIVFSLSGCDSNQPEQLVDLTRTVSEQALLERGASNNAGIQTNQWIFGFDLRTSPEEDARQYLPFLKFLEKTTGQRFLLKFAPKTLSTVDMIGQNKVDMASMGSVGYIKAKIAYGAVILARGKNAQGRGEYRSMLVVRPDSPIQTIKQIKGRRFAFGNYDSTQGHLIPRIILAKNHIQLQDLAAYDYTGSHLRCADAVISGSYDVCGLQDQMAEHLAEQGLVRIIYRSHYYPSSGIVASQQMSPGVRKSIRQALIEFDPHQPGLELYHWAQTEMPEGFVKAADTDYQELENWMRRLKFIAPASTMKTEKNDDLSP